MTDAIRQPLTIAIVGERRGSNPTHLGTEVGLRHAAEAVGCDVDVQWLPTTDFDLTGRRGPAAARGSLDELSAAHGVFIAPGSPYASMHGALNAIEHARTRSIPLLGTCAGLQHVILEYGRNALAIPLPGHTEYDADAPDPFIVALECSLAGQSFQIELVPGTRAADAYTRGGISGSPTEDYYCSYGPEHERLAELVEAGLVVSGTDTDGTARIVELGDHPFFVATLFVPQMRSSPGRPHPLVAAFVEAAAGDR
ncbi:MAG: CTP synthase [Acidimicrobiia bacterium]|nr:CTP synthase [Acidimicrobiia bacterium]